MCRYAAGATIQVLLFSVLAVEIKRKCPAIHTVLEIILARWGTPAHLVFMFFCCITNLIVTAMLILGGTCRNVILRPLNAYRHLKRSHPVFPAILPHLRYFPVFTSSFSTAIAPVTVSCDSL